MQPAARGRRADHVTVAVDDVDVAGVAADLRRRGRRLHGRLAAAQGREAALQCRAASAARGVDARRRSPAISPGRSSREACVADQRRGAAAL